MKIEDLIGTTLQEIEARKWNPYLGISINNKTFTLDYIASFMKWAAPRAKDKAAVIVVDILQRINNEVFDKSNPIPALEKAFRKADEVSVLCKKALEMLSPEQREKIVLLEWPDVMEDECFRYNAGLLNDAFRNDEAFRNILAGITRRNLGPIVERLDSSARDHLTLYILSELPELLAGFQHKGIHYNLNVYPGALPKSFSALTGSEPFQKILPQLKQIGPFATAEAY